MRDNLFSEDRERTRLVEVAFLVGENSVKIYDKWEDLNKSNFMFPVSFYLLFCKSYMCIYMYMPINVNFIVINVCILTNTVECSNAHILFTFRKLKVDIHFKCFAKHVFYLCLGLSSQKKSGVGRGIFWIQILLLLKSFQLEHGLFYSNKGTCNKHFCTHTLLSHLHTFHCMLQHQLKNRTLYFLDWDIPIPTYRDTVLANPPVLFFLVISTPLKPLNRMSWNLRRTCGV